MDGTAAIDDNLAALRRILASLFAMAGLATGAGLDPLPVLRAGGDRRTLPRHLYRAVLRLLRPAESAARRLIIALARGIVVALPPARQARPRKAKPTSFVRNGVGTGIVMPRALPGALRGTVTFFPKNGAAGSGSDTGGNKGNCPQHPSGRRLSFPLLDPLRQPFRRRRPVATSVPRICVPGYTAPFPIAVRQSPSPDDPVDAMRLGRRLAALALALDDLPAQARRFARWRARNDQLRGQPLGSAKFRRISPLRFGRPPGGRLSRYDPTAAHPRNIREVDKILAHAHALAVYALERRDTS